MAGRPDPNAALTALNRFGFGARPGDIEKAAGDPRGFLKAELRRPDVALVSLDDPDNVDLLGSTPALQASFSAEYQRKLERERTAAAMQLTPTENSPSIIVLRPDAPTSEAKPAQGSAIPGGTNAMAPGNPPAMGKPKSDPQIEQKIFRAEARARFEKAVSADAGFVERLVHFWSNHFCVSVAKSNLVRVTAGAFEREAVRPYVLGRFVDMLAAVERHPAMLVYLDNQQSIGPDSRNGQSGKRGLNENLAREILELHTLGVNGGYAQTDVTAFARVLTGWMMAGREGRLGEPGSFVFNANAHQPGDEMLLGKTYPAAGVGQGEAVLDDIARHPATALHIALKLARHFIADDPPAAVVSRLAKIFHDKDGDLRALANALVDAPETWDAPMTKLRSPSDYLIAIRRAVHPEPMPDPGPMLGGLNALGAPLWQPPGPNGFPDTAGAWASAQGMKVRLDLAWQTARQVKNIGNPSDLLEAVIGPAASPESRLAVARAESKQQGLAVLLMSPEFQRR